MKRLYYLLTVFMLAFLSSCNNDETDEAKLGNQLSGKWHLSVFNGSYVDWGEYMEFSGKTLKWNNRMRGENTTYSITYHNSNTSFDAKCTYCSTNEDISDLNTSFSITAYNENTLILIDEYFDIREFRK